MRVLEKVIFDTNIIRNTWAETFFGGREILEQFSKVAEIVIPDIIMEEIRFQKRRGLESKKQSFLDNPFHWLLWNNEETTKSFEIDKLIADIEDKEEIPYSIIMLTDASALEKIKHLALNYEAPFEPRNKEDKNNSDKGFKDTYAYFTILEYLQNIEDKYVFFCSKDWRLKEALSKLPNVKIVENFEDFKKQSILSFLTPYFVEKIGIHLGFSISETDIHDFWINTNDNHVLQIENSTGKFRIEVDTGEIIWSTQIVDDFDENMNMFINAGSFQTTHGTVSFLQDYLNYFSDNEVISILKAAVENDQIRWIIGDEDVKEFVGTLFKAKWDLLDVDGKERLGSLIL